MTPLGVKTCGESEFDIFEAKKRFPESGKTCVLKRNAIFETFRFDKQAFPKSWKRFFASKISNSLFPHIFIPRGVIFRNF